MAVLSALLGELNCCSEPLVQQPRRAGAEAIHTLTRNCSPDSAAVSLFLSLPGWVSWDGCSGDLVASMRVSCPDTRCTHRCRSLGWRGAHPDCGAHRGFSPAFVCDVKLAQRQQQLSPVELALALKQKNKTKHCQVGEAAGTWHGTYQPRDPPCQEMVSPILISP